MVGSNVSPKGARSHNDTAMPRTLSNTTCEAPLGRRSVTCNVGASETRTFEVGIEDSSKHG